jgi:molybdopterin-dependent oxidoreductase alpha subunit
VGLTSTLGSGTATIVLEDLKHADLIWVIGANPSSNHPRLMTELLKCRRRGGKVIIVNPLKEPGLVRFKVPSDWRSMLLGNNRIATDYIQPNIGGDLALFKGIAKVLLGKSHVDSEFIANYTYGFNVFSQDVKETPWEEIVEVSGLDQSQIEYLAGEYHKAENVVFSWAMGITHHEHGVENVESIVNLALLRGMVGRKHAGLLPLRGHSNVQGVGSVGVTPVLKEKVFKNIEEFLGIQLPKQPGLDTMASMKAAFNDEIDFALLLGGNLYSATPDAAFADTALNRIPFKAFVTTTLNQSHLYGVEGEVVILPVAARDEEKQATTQESMFNFVRMSDGGIVRLDNVRSEVEIIADIAEGVLGQNGVDFSSFKTHRNIRKAIAHTIPGFEKIGEIDETKEEFQISGRTFHEPQFETPDGKAHFKVVPIPSLKGGDTEFQLTSVRSEGQFNTIVYEEEDTFRGIDNRWVVMMNADDMIRLDVAENDRVDIHNETGIMERVKVKSFDIPAGNAAAFFPEANVLIPTILDPRSKTPGFKSNAVKIIPTPFT